MYKQRFKKWNFVKYCTANERKRILHWKREMEALGLGPETMTPDQIIDHKKLLNHMKRKPLPLESLQSCMPRSLRSPKAFEDHEVLLLNISNYAKRSFESSILNEIDGYIVIDISIDSFLLAPFLTSLNVASTMIQRSAWNQAGLVLLKSFALIEKILENANYEVLLDIFFIYKTYNTTLADIIELLICQFRNLAGTILPELHPLRIILTQISPLEPGASLYTISLAWKHTVDALHHFTQPNNFSVLFGLVDFYCFNHDFYPGGSKIMHKVLVDCYHSVEATYSEADWTTDEILRQMILINNRGSGQWDEEHEANTMECIRLSKIVSRSFNTNERL